MTLLLSESDVRAVLTMLLALEAVEESFRRQGAGEIVLHPRRRIEMPERSFLHYMAAADTAGDYAGMKIYTSVRGAVRFLVPLYRARTGELLALIEADYLGQMRTGAASGVATRCMARAEARTVGMVGTGLQARTQLEAVAAVRRIERATVFGRNPERLAGFCREMTERLKFPVTPARSAEQAIRGADIAVAATTSSRPVIFGEWLQPGMHVNAIGANFPQKRELDDEAVRRAVRIVVDSVEQSRMEAGDLVQAFGGDGERWREVRELADVVTGKAPGRASPGEVTLFKSNGVASWDVAVAGRVYELACERQLGIRIPLWEHCG